MDELTREKSKIREKYKGISPDVLQVIPAVEIVDFYADESHKRVAVYARVSTGDPRQTSSFELQRNYYHDTIQRHIGWELVQIYADEGISGTSLKHRDAFLGMIEDCENGKIDLIVTKSVSRFARNVYDCIGYVRKLAALKPPVGVFFETENLYTLNKDSEMALSFIATLAQEESHTKSSAMNLSYEMRFQRGIFLTPALLGYDLDGNGQLTVNEAEARTVRLIFFMYLYGVTCQRIAQTLTQLGCSTKPGNCAWTPGTVLNVLQNERHCGDVLARKTWTPNYLDHKSKKNAGNRNQYMQTDHHEAIISRDDFIAVQRLIANAKYGYKGLLPSLRVIDSGILKGFVGIHPKWAGFGKDDYIDAAATVEAGGDWREPDCHDYKAGAGEFDLRGYEIVRGQFFRSAQDLTVTFSMDSICFSSVCVQKLEQSAQVELLLDPRHRFFAVRPAVKGNRNAVAWAKYDGRHYLSKPIGCAAFIGTLFDMCGWNKENKYKIRGICKRKEREAVLLFDLHDTEITLLSRKTASENADFLRRTAFLPEDVSPLTTNSQKNVIAYPENWFRTFGTAYYRHAQIQELLSVSRGEEWGVLEPGKAVKASDEIKPSTEAQLHQNINSLLGAMREAVSKNGQ